MSGKSGRLTLLYLFEITLSYNMVEKLYDGWSQLLIQLSASMEAAIDFGEDEIINMRVVDDVFNKV
jgi:tRNA U34 5-carboxymethylaminomethyl modifying GTPase MnmE/TrmE